jgi:hypothetical protein
MSNPLDAIKFTEADGSIAGDAALVGHLVVDMPDRPSAAVPPWTAAQIKGAMDYLVTNVIGPRINDFVDALKATADGSSGADGIGVTTIAGMAGGTVQALLESLKAAVDNAVAGTVPDGSVTDAKMSTDQADIFARFAAHVVNFSLHYYYLGATAGTLTAFTATGTDFDDTAASLLIIKPHLTCGAAPTLSINGGTPRTIKPANAVSLSAGQMLQNGLYFVMWLPGATPLMLILNPEPDTVPNALKVGGHTLYVQSTQPVGAVANDLWAW